MRSILLSSIIGLIVTACGDVASGDGGTTAPPPPPAPVVTLGPATPGSGDGQSGTVATTLSLPLRVVVDSAGTPQVGVTVIWDALDGTLEPQSSVTDADGLATAMWSLDTVSGGKSASAVVAGVKGSPVRFRATAMAGRATTIEKVAGDPQTVAANRPFGPLSVRLTDQYHNYAGGQPVTWTVENGPLTVLSHTAATDGIGVSSAQVATQRKVGNGTVRATLAGSSSRVDFTLHVGPPEAFLVILDQGRAVFISAQNRTLNPAVDTVTAGQRVEFRCQNFDYGSHRLRSLGEPSFEPQDFSYYCESEPLYVTFTTPGTYRYADLSSAIGSVVVQ